MVPRASEALQIASTFISTPVFKQCRPFVLNVSERHKTDVPFGKWLEELANNSLSLHSSKNKTVGYYEDSTGTMGL